MIDVSAWDAPTWVAVLTALVVFLASTFGVGWRLASIISEKVNAGADRTVLTIDGKIESKVGEMQAALGEHRTEMQRSITDLRAMMYRDFVHRNTMPDLERRLVLEAVNELRSRNGDGELNDGS